MLPLLTALGRGERADIEARFEQGYRRDFSRIVRAAATDAGWIQVSPTASGLHLDQIHLGPQWCGLGIGSMLLRRLLARAHRTHVAVALDVLRGNRAIDLYRRFGFTVVGSDHEKYQMVWRPPQP
jgi:ribosomal protein S18 acetylase RimI-like enzyme